ncbi:MAG: hypothetical protein K9K93_03995 [Acholeplasmataceae bacterium]|nr:hypothetical protein [Acholeplasmataceae bacterium]
MPRKWMILIILIASLGLMVSCRDKDKDPDDVVTPDIKDIIGLEDMSSPRGLYVDPLKDVLITDEHGKSINHLLTVEGQVQYGTLGSYDLHYSLSYAGKTLNETRTITITESPIIRESASRETIAEPFQSLGEGVYRSGTASDMTHPVNPSFMNPDLLGQAVPSNSWWTSLLVANRGAGNGLYTNPLRASFQGQGLEITNPGAGFIQHWNPDGYHTIANFSLALPDMFLWSSDLNASYTTHVIGYGDSDVRVAMRNPGDQKDHMVLTLAQGSPYVFADVMNKTSPHLVFPAGGVDGYAYYTIDGTPINDSQYIGDGLVVKLIRKHVGYDTYPPAQVGQPFYNDRYFVISAPELSTFDFSSSGHPQSLINRVDMALSEGNTLSIAAINGLEEASFYHEHAYVKTIDSDVSYVVDDKTSAVLSTYRMASQSLNPTRSSDPVQFLMPHHYQNSTAETLPYTFRTVRGELRLMLGHTFQTELSFQGLVPAMALPPDHVLDPTRMATYLAGLDQNTRRDDASNFFNDPGPYWNGKALYPLSQGLIIADQIGDDALASSFASKLKHLISDWLTYEGPTDDRYFYYNEAWGTLYDATNDFNTAGELSDHRFTYGYLVYAAAILAMHDDDFKADYGDMVTMLLHDYLYPEKDAYDFSYLRSFDPWAGHTWAHGFGTFAEGNNIESSSEAIHAWVAGYLWALETGDEDLRDAAIYGFVHEFNFAKTYMFDYEENIFPEAYSDYASVAGIVWGGKYDYATWFGPNPTFIYGIQWLPNGEYLSGYALTATDKVRLSSIYQMYLDAKGGVIDTWYAQMWSIAAFLDPTAALGQFQASLILGDDYPDDLPQTYYLLNTLSTYGMRSDAFHMHLHPRVTSSFYKDARGTYRAILWNASDDEATVTFEDDAGTLVTKTVSGKTLTSVVLR